jgi:polyferredoxin
MLTENRNDRSIQISARQDAPGLDLLRIRPIAALIRWPGFPYIFQALILVIFLGLIINGWGLSAPAGINDKLYAKTNLTTLVIWGLWWPSMIWAAVLLGRAWCMICPLELVSNVSERVGRWLCIRQRPVRRWLISGVIIVSLYALLQLLVAGAHIHRVPAYTAVFLLGLLILPVVTGLFFKDRAFCRAFCPVGQLLATYGRGGMLAVRAGSGETCGTCTGKDCIMSCNRTRLDARSCPSLLNPPRLNTNRDCLVCGQCIKVCQPDNMKLLLRRPFPTSDVREAVAGWPTTAFVMLVSGFVTWELSAEWVAAEENFLALPHWVSSQAGIASYSGYLNWLWALVLVPLTVWFLLALVLRGLGEQRSTGEIWRRLALPIAVVVSIGHMVKGLLKFNSWAGFLPSALADPVGLNTIRAFANKTATQPATLLPVSVVAIIGIALVITGLLFAVREARLADPQLRNRRLIPLAAFAAAFLFIVSGIALQQ